MGLWFDAGPGVAGDPAEEAYVSFSHHRRVPAVRSYLVARGIGGISRNQFAAANSFREPSSDRQTYAGPFDHGFFFDSGTAPHGGDSPYLH